ncbi:MAG: DDE-type integrase/transposase/recombinase [Treponema sp.]|nr:DDE-type integrase/transposase/recombinase [Treponema sp.]
MNRAFHAEGGGEKWVSDIICLRTQGDWVYLTVVLDLFDRKIIGRAFSDDMETVHTAIAALEMAFAKGPVREGLRGVQY